jgi:perosamine synthetase
MSDIWIPLSVPSIKGNEWKYIKECLDTQWVSSAGQYVGTFEEKVSEYTGASYAIAVVNGTAALHISLIVAGVSPGDEVIVPTLTFIAPVNVISYVGAVPVFMDCDEYYNIDARKTIQFIEERTEFTNGHSYNKQSGRRVSAVIPVHVFGNAVRIDELADICNRRNIRIVEDAAESLGTWYTRGRCAGMHTGTVGNIGCFSFNGNKVITTGGGGMIVTNNKEYATRCRHLSTQAKSDPLRYIHNEIGYNYRLTNIQAAMGVAQLETLPEFIRKKKQNYAEYKTRIDKLPGLHLAEVPDYADQNHWFYSLQVERDSYGMTRDELMNHLREKNIQSRPVWYLNHRQSMYAGCRACDVSKALDLWERTLNIPCSVNLSADEIDAVISALVNRMA